tara:strand:+ start:152 stop:286 length:135 start_codon:yes stop_codon:yes gene_type:complete
MDWNSLATFLDFENVVLIEALNWALDGESRIPLSCNIAGIIEQK